MHPTARAPMSTTRQAAAAAMRPPRAAVASRRTPPRPAAPPPKRRRAGVPVAAAAVTAEVVDADLVDLVAPAPKTASPSPLPTAQGLAASLAPQSEALTRLKLAFALPWRRTGSRAVLVIRAEGDIGDKPSGGRIFGGSTLTVPQIVRALEKAALDPRIEGVALRIGPISAGWAKLQEIGEAFAAFRASGKWSRAWIERGGEKELYLATMADRVCVPPVPGSLSVRGIVLAGTFLRGPLEKAGVTPEITRIGAFKSAGDSLLRKDMSEAQREALGAIVDDVYSHYTEEVAARRGLTPAAVAAALDAAFTEPGDLIKAGLIDGTQYEDEVVEELRVLTGLDPEAKALADGKRPKRLRAVPLKKYARVSPSAFGLAGAWGAPRIAVVRASGAITGGGGGGGGSSSNGITPGPLVSLLNALADDKRIAAVVLRIDSPGGDALASDLIWRAARRLAARKVLVASMGDLAASGGYYIAMAAPTIVAQPLTLTGSIGIVTGKVALGGEGPGGSGENEGGKRSVYERLGGYNKTLVSRGRYAELLTETRPFSAEERALFQEGAATAYASFRDKAAGCRGKSRAGLEALAQGRVWTGKAALEAGLVDALGGTATAVAIAAAAAGVPAGVRPRVYELSRARVSPLALVTGGGGASALLDVAGSLAAAFTAAASGDVAGVARALAGLAGVGSSDGAGAAAAAQALAAGRVVAAAPDVRVVGSSEL